MADTVLVELLDGPCAGRVVRVAENAPRLRVPYLDPADWAPTPYGQPWVIDRYGRHLVEQGGVNRPRRVQLALYVQDPSESSRYRFDRNDALPAPAQ